MLKQFRIDHLDLVPERYTSLLTLKPEWWQLLDNNVRVPSIIPETVQLAVTGCFFVVN